jgi:hypothetical protein
MAKDQYLTPKQRGIVQRYYASEDTRVVQRLQELASDLYLATTPAQTKKLWGTVEKELVKTNADPKEVAKVLGAKDIKGLATILAKPGLMVPSKPRGDRAPGPPDTDDDL